MRSKISKKILSETSQETKDKVNDYANKLVLSGVGSSADSDENKVHYEALLDCCNKLLDTVDAGKVPKKEIIGLKILLNR